ncbi:N-acetyltransferase [Halolactibacillus alkaliphilus]|uniref:N-acetyltransferase n=2 Tax=Halolactibacillus alkaliphilus TaxID=442899 RepID=A0A511X3G0_9BACI|nr:N-acetyltransferase [Halolactibacillus alkaliphilus]GGN68348.1 N-acetyltransferase [Halolactibacillus alkaliphilus]SFO95391.1 Ribosomal protein S18 acetylase RimI [Halolactibacillus alkaliphilus]
MMLTDHYRIVKQALTPDIYCKLRESVGFQPYAYEDVAVALENTLFSVVIFDRDQPVATGRVVGDGRICFFIKDVVIAPDYQGQSLGKVVMAEIDAYIENVGCDGAYIGLMATPGTEGFYECCGFIQRPTASLGAGMVKFLHKSCV